MTAKTLIKQAKSIKARKGWGGFFNLIWCEVTTFYGGGSGEDDHYEMIPMRIKR